VFSAEGGERKAYIKQLGWVGEAERKTERRCMKQIINEIIDGKQPIDNGVEEGAR